MNKIKAELGDIINSESKAKGFPVYRAKTAIARK